MRIAIVEDDPKASDLLTEYCQRLGAATQRAFSIDVFKNPIIFLSNYCSVYDIVLMDIEMPHMDGMEAAQRLREIDPDVTLLFVTNMSQYAVRGYEVGAFDFLVKPVTYAAFSMKLEDAIVVIEQRAEQYIFIHTENGLMKVPASTVSYIEVLGHRLTYHMDFGEIEARGSLNRIEDEQPELGFLRCNNCYLVNPRRITRVGKNSVFLGSEELPISRPRKAEFLQNIADYFGSLG